MPIISGLALIASAQSRFKPVSTLPGLPPIMIDSRLDYRGPTRQVASKYGLEGRVLWIDATANVDRYNTVEKIIALVAKIKESGFNTIVFDVKPISSEVVYPSKFAPKLLEWKGKILGDFDPLGPMSVEARKNKLSFYVSMNAFCDGHRLVNRGPGFNRPDEQSVVYESKPMIRVGDFIYTYSAKPSTSTVSLLTALPNDGQTYGFPCDRFGNLLADGAPLPKGGYWVVSQGLGAASLASMRSSITKVEILSQPSFVRIGQSSDKQYPLMTSPTNPSVRLRLMDMLTELTTNYDMDGVIFDDRLRYTGLNGDFTDVTRSMFEQHVKAKLNWPNDVFEYSYSFTNGVMNKGVRPGKYYDAWMAWRASILQGFVREARTHIRKIKPTLQLGVYAGSWYGDYQQYGNNWASPAMDAGFWFLTPEYKKTGFSPDLDFLITGCYYQNATIYDAMTEGKGIGATIEAAGNLSYRGTHDETWVYAGLSLADFKDNAPGLEKALQAAVGTTNGVMVFDLSHDIEPMWPVFQRAFSFSKIAPHSNPAYLAEARALRKTREKAGFIEPPIVIAAGSAGVGF